MSVLEFATIPFALTMSHSVYAQPQHMNTFSKSFLHCLNVFENTHMHILYFPLYNVRQTRTNTAKPEVETKLLKITLKILKCQLN